MDYRFSFVAVYTKKMTNSIHAPTLALKNDFKELHCICKNVTLAPDNILKEINKMKAQMTILCEASTRHVHLKESDVETLYGKGATLGHVRDLSQPGQFLSDKRLTLVGPKGTMEGVAVLGPTRPDTQIELALTDCFKLGLKDVPVRQSGNVKNTPGIILRNEDKSVKLDFGVIVMQRHVHLDPATAEKNGFKDGDIVSIVLDGPRGGTFGNTVVRVHKNFAPAVHLDTDENNAMRAGNLVTIIKE